MKISQVNVNLNSSDILSIINEFLHIKELTIKHISVVNNELLVEGSLKKGISINFEVVCEIVKCENNNVYIKISRAKFLKLGILRVMRSFILKQITKSFSNYGISNEKEVAIINIDSILKDVPYVNFNLKKIYIIDDKIHVEAENIEISLAGTLIKKVETEKVEDEKEIDLDSLEKISDNYSKGREIIKNKLPEKGKEYSDYIFMLPDIVSLIYRLIKDKRVPLKTKIMISASAAYLAIPGDIIPDWIPFIGRIDDIGVIFFTLNRIANDVPIKIIVENWEGSNELLIVLKGGLDYIINFTSARNVDKFYSVISELSNL